ncbi:EcsC family protein [Niallia taxi]|uniref:EcsC family protein n=1 Tax=Niallia taxi TaxID=2499688 RepID=UPI00119F233C|nr:EcsC family protein [Niallia taxi]MCT2343014.1 EcsC family protein [Niallia taxi]MED3962320.1 EcsC family protein [Niallia taxi]WOD64057.1 EcsC family protein [Niallia taxi]
MLTYREEEVLKELSEWERVLFSYDKTDLESLYEKYVRKSMSFLEESKWAELYSIVDSSLFHAYTMLLSSSLHENSNERMLSTARIFNENITDITDMKKLTIDQLHFIGQQQMAKNRLYACFQGGIAGTGGIAAAATDFLALMVINIRFCQQTSALFGSPGNTPTEIMTALKVLHGACLPKRLQGRAWAELMEEMERPSNYFYEGTENVASNETVEVMLQQTMKMFFIFLFGKKTYKKMPFVSMLIGAGANYQYTKKITEFSYKYYQRRYLYEKLQGGTN